MLQLVAEGPTSIGGLLDGAAERGVDRNQARQVVTAMLAGGILSPLADLSPGDEAVAACNAFNREALMRAKRGEAWPALASPLLGSGVAVRVLEQRVLAGATPEPAEPAEPKADRLYEDETQQVTERLQRLEAQRPYLQRLGVVCEDGPSAR